MSTDSHTVTSETAAEFYATRLPQRAPAPPADAPAPADAKTDDASESNPPKKPKPIQPRINELVGERNAARDQADAKTAEAEQLRRELDDVKKKLETLASPAPKEQADRPRRDQFATDEDFAAANADWEFEIRLAAHYQQVAQQRLIQNWSARLEAARVDLPDYDEVVGKSEINMPQVVLDAIIESDVGAQISYHLAKNPAEAKRIASLRPASAAREIGRLEAQFASGSLTAAPVAAPAPAAPGKNTGVERSKAPEPIESLRGSPAASVPADRSKMTHEEWKAARKAGLIR